ncbi:MAG: polysaccharide deacetylase family protein [Nitrosopumilus sp.]|nr:polysaccharide deacetylase family protein [Nitrosopumilus sp.]
MSKRYKFVSHQDMIDYYDRKISLKNSCHITFDDGDISVYNIAFPILKEKNIPATLFVSPLMISQGTNYWFQDLKHLDHEVVRQKFKLQVSDKPGLESFGPNQFLKSQTFSTIDSIIRKVKNETHPNIPSYNMSDEQLKELAESNFFTIGAHTLHHPILSNESDSISAGEILDSVRDLSILLNKKVDAFAFPNGLETIDYGSRELGIIKSSDVSVSYSCTYNFFSQKCNRYAIPRVEIENGGDLKIKAKTFYIPVLLNWLLKNTPNGPYGTRKKIHRLLSTNGT